MWATAGSTEEALVNALVAGRTTTIRGGKTVPGLLLARVREVVHGHGLFLEAH
jgi:hypothetical protein